MRFIRQFFDAFGKERFPCSRTSVQNNWQLSWFWAHAIFIKTQALKVVADLHTYSSLFAVDFLEQGRSRIFFFDCWYLVWHGLRRRINVYWRWNIFGFKFFDNVVHVDIDLIIFFSDNFSGSTQFRLDRSLRNWTKNLTKIFFRLFVVLKSVLRKYNLLNSFNL